MQPWEELTRHLGKKVWVECTANAEALSWEDLEACEGLKEGQRTYWTRRSGGRWSEREAGMQTRCLAYCGCHRYTHLYPQCLLQGRKPGRN